MAPSARSGVEPVGMDAAVGGLERVTVDQRDPRTEALVKPPPRVSGISEGGGVQTDAPEPVRQDRIHLGHRPCFRTPRRYAVIRSSISCGYSYPSAAATSVATRR